MSNGNKTYIKRIKISEYQLKNFEREGLFEVDIKQNRKGIPFIRAYSFVYDPTQNGVSQNLESECLSINEASAYKFEIGKGILRCLRSKIPIEIPQSGNLTILLDPDK